VWRFLRFIPSGALTFIKRHTPARLRFAVRQRFGADYRRIPDTIATSPDGRRFHIGPDPVYWAIHHGLDYEPEATGILRKILRADDVVLDVGANIGWYATLCATLVGGRGHVYAFEPVPATRARLEENIALNRMQDRITVVSKAVGGTMTEGTMHVLAAGPAWASLSPLGASLTPLKATQHTTVPVEITTLDEFVRSTRVGRATFLKCDVEGAELDVLSGARSLLSAADAPIVLIELNQPAARAFGHSKADLIRFLQQVGYELFFDPLSDGKLRTLRDAADLARVDIMFCGKGSEISRRIETGRVSVVN